MDARVKVGCVPPEVRDEAMKAAAALGISISEYTRRAIFHLATQKTNPFPESSGARGKGRPRKPPPVSKA